MQEAYTFDDVILVPQYSEIASRSEVDISTTIGTIRLKIPIVAANMSTVCDLTMARAIGSLGGLGVLHRYVSTDTMLEWIKELRQAGLVAVPSIGAQPADYVAAEKYREFTDKVCVDIAHGDSKMVVDVVKYLKSIGFVDIIAGNVATGSGAYRLLKAGANIIKVGIGGGAACTTQVVTGHGMPQLSAIMEAYEAVKGEADIVGDGGIKNSGDLVKALGGGSSAVMIGRLLAGTDESPGDQTYAGMASESEQLKFRGKVNNGVAEGVTVKLPKQGPVSEVIEQLCGGIRSGLSYSGCRSLKEFRGNCIFRLRTTNGLIEGHPHALTLK